RRRPLRRRVVRMGPDPRGRDANGRRGSCVLSGPDRAQQNSALCGIRRGIPDDGHRENPEIPDARGSRSPARAQGGEDGVTLSYPPLKRGGRNHTGKPCLFASSFSETCGRAPICWITSAAASAPSRPAFSYPALRTRPNRKPAAKRSPAPVVSTSSLIGEAGTATTPSFDATTQPFSLRVTTPSLTSSRSAFSAESKSEVL